LSVLKWVIDVLLFSKGFVVGVAKIGGFLRLPLNSERLQKLAESYMVSNTKIKLAIGKQLPVKTGEGLLKTFGSFKR
jgi:hypothetical protein